MMRQGRTVNRPSQSHLEYVNVKGEKRRNLAFKGKKRKRKSTDIGVHGDFIMDTLENENRTQSYQDEIQRSMEIGLDAIHGHNPKWYNKNAAKISSSMNVLKHDPMSGVPVPEAENIPGHPILMFPGRTSRESDIGTRPTVKGYKFGSNTDSVLDVPYAVYNDGTVEYRDKNGELHHPSGPALINPDGREDYYDRGVKTREVTPGGVETEFDPEGRITGITDPNNPNAWNEHVAAEQKKEDDANKITTERKRLMGKIDKRDEEHRQELLDSLDEDGYAEVDVWYKNGKPAGYGEPVEGTNGWGSKSVSVPSTVPGWGNMYLSVAKNPETARKNNAKKGIEMRREKVKATISDDSGAYSKARIGIEADTRDADRIDPHYEPEKSGRYSLSYRFDDIK